MDPDERMIRVAASGGAEAMILFFILFLCLAIFGVIVNTWFGDISIKDAIIYIALLFLMIWACYSFLCDSFSGSKTQREVKINYFIRPPRKTPKKINAKKNIESKEKKLEDFGQSG